MAERLPVEGAKRTDRSLKKKEVYLTPDGYAQIEKELDYLRTVRRREIADRIKQAKEFGDITDNSEYEDAKNDQAVLEAKIARLEELIRCAHVIEGDEVDTTTVSLGSRVRLKQLQCGEVVEYLIVGSEEADPSRSKISNESPLGKALMGQRAGAVVEVAAPIGLVRYEVLGISR